MERFDRTERLLGPSAMEKLAAARVAVFGIGGVGGYVVEALARSGVGTLMLVDADKVAMSNVNRQIVALESTLGRFKAEVAAERVRDIHPNCNVTPVCEFYSPESAGKFDFSSFDYVVDAVDDVTAKLSLVEQTRRVGVPIISCMGTGNKLDPTAFRVSDIKKTSVCPLCRVMRTELRKRGIDGLKVVWSPEVPAPPTAYADGKRVIASTAFVPPAAGLLIASEVVKDLIK